MKKLLRTTFSTLTALLFVASATVVAQQSDYQIQQDFRAEYNEIVNRVDNAVSTDELIEVAADIDALEADYSEYSAIINAAIYPDTFANRISDLRNRYSAGENNVSVIEQLNERIRDLMSEMDDFRSRLAQMDEEAADLKEQIDRSSANERRQAALIRQYRQNIEQRDAFVADVLEQLMTRYQELDSSTQAEISDAAERMSDNPVELLKTFLAQYTNMADQDSGLETPDFVRMRAQHEYFSDVWNRIGERLTSTFSPDNPVESRQEVTDMLAAWQASIDNKLWNSLTTSFNQNGIELPPFTSASTFNNALNAYVDNAMEVSMESNSEEDYEVFRNFSNYWNNTVKASWGELLVNGNILSTSQIAAIDVKLNTWGETAQPTSNLMFILFLISLAVIIGLIVLLVTRKG
jgi:predicted  nucleic acid-binding Zn-ribbon protein